MKTQNEILTEIKSMNSINDFNENFRQILVLALNYDNAKKFIHEKITREIWEHDFWLNTQDKIVSDLKDYLELITIKNSLGEPRKIDSIYTLDRLQGYAFLLDDKFLNDLSEIRKTFAFQANKIIPTTQKFLQEVLN